MRYGAGFQLMMAAALLCGPVALAQDDDPGRGVARISVTNGDVSVRRGDSGDWVAAAVNAPLVVQDAIATGPGSRAEVQLDYANLLRLGSNAEVRLTELEFRRYQMQVVRGTVEFRVLRNSDAEAEVSTPAVSVRPAKKGAYRIHVRENGETEVTVRSGEVEVYTPRGVERVRSGNTMVVRNDPSGPEFQMVRAEPYDEFDRWNEQRDRALERSASYRYVSPYIYGADDLDGYGRWVYDPAYGWVWVPNVAPGWAPYRYGRWSWVDYYGWSWISYDPWGWAPFHYGRWYHGHYGWSWYPGDRHHRHYWSPGLVAFFGFGGTHVGIGFGLGHVGWVPLAPHEPYHRWYGRNYYRSGGYVDRSVNITNNVNITNIYRNSRVNNAVTAVDGSSFGRGNGNIVRVANGDLRQARLVRGQLPVGPSAESIRFADREARNVPRSGAENRNFFTRRQPTPVERVSFSEQQRRFQAPAERAAAGQPAAGTVREVNRSENARGWRRTGEPQQRPAAAAPAAGDVKRVERQGSTDNVRNWRRFGEPRTETPNAGSARETAPRNTEGNWRRSGEPRTETPAAGSTPQSVPRNRESGWKRFGEPRTETPGVESRQQTVPRSREGGWSRFGETPAPRTEDRGSRSFDHGRSERFGSVGSTPPAPRVELREQRSTPRSVEVAPRVLRERSYESAPRIDRAPRGDSAPRMERSAPRMERSAPRMESAPRGGGDSGSRGGGSSHSGRAGGRNR
ncbi:MAG: DUF6600 domain-containing protein [Bryobacteraceae bacterium]